MSVDTATAIENPIAVASPPPDIGEPAHLLHAFIAMPMLTDYAEGDALLSEMKAAAESEGFYAERVDEITHYDRISNVIVDAIRSTTVVIADLSLARPNVYYEIGFAHALGKPVILICRGAESAHFDVRDFKIYYYTDHLGLALHLKKELAAIREWATRMAAESEAEPPPSAAEREASAKLEVLRTTNGVVALNKLDNDRRAYEVGAGVYFFITPWGADKIRAPTRDWGVNCEPGGTVKLEVHFSEVRGPGFVLYESREIHAKSDDELIVSPSFVVGKFEEPIFVEFEDIVGCRHRDIESVDILDIQLTNDAKIYYVDGSMLAQEPDNQAVEASAQPLLPAPPVSSAHGS